MQNSLLNLIYAQMLLNNISIELVKEVEVAILAKMVEMANNRQIVNNILKYDRQGPLLKLLFELCLEAEYKSYSSSL